MIASFPRAPHAVRGLSLVGLGMLFASVVQAAPLDEATVMRLAAERAPELRVASASVDAQRASEQAAGVPQNPSLEWSRQHIPGDSPSSEANDTIALSVPLDLSGRLAARVGLARSQTSVARAELSSVRAQAVRRALQLFYAAIAAEQQAQLTHAVVQGLDEAARVLSRRRQEGTASGYEEARLRVELELMRSEHAEQLARAQTARIELAALLDVASSTLELPHTLGLPVPTPAATALASGTQTDAQPQDERPSLQHARAALQDAQAAASRADDAWLPPIELSGGVQLRTTDKTYAGYAAGVAVTLPLVSSDQGLGAQASARVRVVDAELMARHRALAVDRARAEAAHAFASTELARFDAAIAAQLEALTRAAQSAYREGHVGVLELVDSHRALARVRGRALELQLAVRQAEVALRAARGDFE